MINKEKIIATLKIIGIAMLTSYFGSSIMFLSTKMNMGFAFITWLWGFMILVASLILGGIFISKIWDNV